MKYIKHILILLLTTALVACGAYSFTGASIPPGTETYQVNRFENTSLLIEPGLERDFKLALEDLIQNQTNLTLVPSKGDLIYEGEITEYRISPTTATSDNRAAQNRLTINIKLRFFNKRGKCFFFLLVLYFVVDVCPFMLKHSERRLYLLLY